MILTKILRFKKVKHNDMIINELRLLNIVSSRANAKRYARGFK